MGYRQWVLSFEGRAAVRPGHDQALLAEERARVRRRTIIGVIAGFTALAIFGLYRGT